MSKNHDNSLAEAAAASGQGASDTYNSDLWLAYSQALEQRLAAELLVCSTRDAIVAKVCSCYSADEPWEQRSVYCMNRLTNSCVFFGSDSRQDRWPDPK